MPTKYIDRARLSQFWPRALLDQITASANAIGWNATQWLQEAARDQIKRQAKTEKHVG